MWIYEKKLQYPIKVKKPDGHMARLILEQYGGGDGEWGASMRYLSQRYTMDMDQAKATVSDIGTEEYAPASCQRSLEKRPFLRHSPPCDTPLLAPRPFPMKTFFSFRVICFFIFLPLISSHLQ